MKLTITALDVSRFKPNSDEVNALAQKAWRSVNKTFKLGEMTVKVEEFGRL